MFPELQHQPGNLLPQGLDPALVRMTVQHRSESSAKQEAGGWALLDSDKRSRAKRTTVPELFVHGEDVPSSLASPGTAVVLVAKKGDALLARVRQALEQGDAASLARAGASVGEYFRSRRPGAGRPEEAVQRLREEPVYAELRCGSKVLAGCLAATDENPLGGVILPYAGGSLRQADLTCIEYASRPGAGELEVLVVAREPMLSPIERAAMEKVATSDTAMLLGPAEPAIWPAVIIAVVAMTLTGTACIDGSRDMAAIQLEDGRVGALGATGSARELLELRREVLLRHR